MKRPAVWAATPTLTTWSRRTRGRFPSTRASSCTTSARIRLLCRLFSELNVVTRQTEMSLSVHCDGCGLEYAGAKGLGGVFAQPRSLANVAFLRLLTQIHRFHRQAQTHSGPRATIVLSLGEFLERGGFSDYFVSHFVVPIVSCVWSVAPGVALQYPARYLFAFLQEPRDAVVYRVAGLAHGRRWIAYLCRPSGQAPERRRHLDSGHGGRHAA